MTSIPPPRSEVDARAKMDLAFRNGEIWSCTESELKAFLDRLNEEGILNDRVQHRAIIRALTINHIQMQRLLEAQERSNAITQRWFMVLAIGSILLGLFGLLLQFEEIRSWLVALILSAR